MSISDIVKKCKQKTDSFRDYCRRSYLPGLATITFGGYLVVQSLLPSDDRAAYLNYREQHNMDTLQSQIWDRDKGQQHLTDLGRNHAIESQEYKDFLNAYLAVSTQKAELEWELERAKGNEYRALKEKNDISFNKGLLWAGAGGLVAVVGVMLLSTPLVIRYVSRKKQALNIT